MHQKSRLIQSKRLLDLDFRTKKWGRGHIIWYSPMVVDDTEANYVFFLFFLFFFVFVFFFQNVKISLLLKPLFQIWCILLHNAAENTIRVFYLYYQRTKQHRFKLYLSYITILNLQAILFFVWICLLFLFLLFLFCFVLFCFVCLIVFVLFVCLFVGVFACLISNIQYLRE